MIKKTGFTLVEMLISMGIMSILLVILTQVFGSILSTKLRSEASSAVAQDGRFIFSRLAYDISRSTSLSVPSSSSLSLTIDGTTYIYSLVGQNLMLSVGGGSNLSLNGTDTTIPSLDFTRFADIGTKKSVQIRLIIASSIIQPGGVTGERQLTTTIATR